LEIKEAITKAAEESVGYKKWKNQKWLRTWISEIQLAIEEKKDNYRMYLQNKTGEHYIEYKKRQAIVRKMTRMQRRDEWDKFVKTLERDITGTQRDVTGTQRDVTGAQRYITGAQRDITEAQRDIREARRDITGAQRDIKGA
jgi:predicted  nucleic acid-binding Zn-ribbon protein